MKAMIACVLLKIMFIIMADILLTIYYRRIKAHNKAMEDFHFFLDSYRHTPRSKHITKYTPPQDAIFEEASQFEKSNWDDTSMTNRPGSVSTIKQSNAVFQDVVS